MPKRIGPKHPVRAYLALWRERHKLTQEQVGGRLEPPVEKATVSRWEAARPAPQFAVVVAYAEALGRDWRDMYRRPSDGPSLDAMADDLPPELREKAADVIVALGGRRAS